MNEDLEIPAESIAAIYAEKIRTLRTRSCTLEIPERENDVEIHHTLLGIELQVGRRRFSCPDLATARYMRVFARLGSREFAIPYDITKISTLADELETAWQRSVLMLENEAAVKGEDQRKRHRSRLYKLARSAVAEIGPGERMPEFKQSTKQRNP
ncbi:MAG TPA: hypothetical protein VMZ26_17920 [Pyrinomonadaceae bacterium]|nr:hypothetical protein [Pyrinomonadaceae bacterium]